MKYDIMLCGRIIRAWRRRSVLGFSRLLLYNVWLIATGKYSEISHAFDQSFDRIFNVETAGTEEPKFLTAEEALKTHAKGYEPVTKEHMEALLGMLPRLDFTDFIFLDFGSGKGRALFVAAEHPFRQIIGVEYSRELHEIAMRNVHTYRNPSQRCFNITPVRADASTFSLPEFPTICFMNNPYDETLVAKTAKHINQSIRSAPRPFFIIYLNAYYTEPFDTTTYGWPRICCGSLGKSPYVIWQWAGKDSKSEGIGSEGIGSYGRGRGRIGQYSIDRRFRSSSRTP
jgi:16S rRNA G966 N2-methylase RsmD